MMVRPFCLQCIAPHGAYLILMLVQNREFQRELSSLPTIPLVCVDEAHCVCEWSHHFRPTYHRLGKYFREELRPHCVLALTATATEVTRKDIAQSLNISPEDIIGLNDQHLRSNLSPSISRTRCSSFFERQNALFDVIRKGTFKRCKSIIVYCSFVRQTEAITGEMRRRGFKVGCYHGGLSDKERQKTQDDFLNDRIRVVVATMAFGLGLDKANVTGIIHYGLPKSPEQYIQEVGRAGRDGCPAYCHVFVDESEYTVLRSLAYSNAVDKGLLERIFGRGQVGKTCAMPLEGEARDFDVKVETIDTIVSWLERRRPSSLEGSLLRYYGEAYSRAEVAFHRTDAETLAGSSVLVEAILNLGRCRQGKYTVDLMAVADYMGHSLLEAQRGLSLLQSSGEIGYQLKDKVSCPCSTLRRQPPHFAGYVQALCYTLLRQPEDLTSLNDDLVEWLQKIEESGVAKLDYMYQVFDTVLNATGDREPDELDEGAVELLKTHLNTYFSLPEIPKLNPPPAIQKTPRKLLSADMKDLVRRTQGTEWTALSLARIFHGLSSQAFPASTWEKHPCTSAYWGRDKHVEFSGILQVAEAVLSTIRQ
eukprot:scaffold101_cov373-Prasinococcus_capsulatus_cf.AAC.16